MTIKNRIINATELVHSYSRAYSRVKKDFRSQHRLYDRCHILYTLTTYFFNGLSYPGINHLW